MNELFLTNMTEETFIDHLRQSLNKCTSFSFSVSFIKYAGFILIQKEIENALIRGAKGHIKLLFRRHLKSIRKMGKYRFVEFNLN